MDRLVARLIPIALCVASPAMAQGFDIDQIFKENDTNRDGRVSAAEVRAAVPAHFDVLDANKDASITRDEVARNLAKHGMGGLTAAIQQQVVTSTFNFYNVDKRGQVTPEDYAQSQVAAMMTSDLNRDGYVTLEEMRALRGSRTPPR